MTGLSYARIRTELVDKRSAILIQFEQTKGHEIGTLPTGLPDENDDQRQSECPIRRKASQDRLRWWSIIVLSFCCVD